jgi:DNA-binding YbaB/EbfC family protein
MGGSSVNTEEELERQLNEAMEKARLHAERVKVVQADVASQEVEGASKDNKVKVKVRGTGRIVKVTIDQDAMRYNSADELGAIVLEAINDGVRKSFTIARTKYSTVLPDVSAFDEVLAEWEPEPAKGNDTHHQDDYQMW